MPLLTDLPLWPALIRHGAAMEGRHLRQLFAEDADRFRHYSLRTGDLLLDYSKQRIVAETLDLLTGLLEQQHFNQQRAALLAGEKVNASEGRAARHTLLRQHDAPAEVLAVRARMLAFAESLRAGEITGHSGKPIRHIIHVGMGGSDLGPRLVAEALADGKGPALHFIHNVDGMALRHAMAQCAAEATLVLLASKTFTTAETFANAAVLKGWCHPSHFVALTAAPEAARAFGIDAARIFPFWDWVGGRFSLWSSVGLAAAIAIGRESFTALLHGAAEMDKHFATAPLKQNMPVLLALLQLWNSTVLKATAQAVLPYCEGLSLLPAYLQQLEMESLGKIADKEGNAIAYATAPVVFGACGTAAQHAFMQALHQGSAVIPADMVLVARNQAALPALQTMLLSHGLAQAQALAFGQTAQALHGSGAQGLERHFPGNRPTTTLVLPCLSPFALGQLLALYEHKVFTLGVLWNVNPFDQWGVELGKALAAPIAAALTNPPVDGGKLDLDSSTLGLLHHLNRT